MAQIHRDGDCRCGTVCRFAHVCGGEGGNRRGGSGCDRQVRAAYEEYQGRLNGITRRAQIADSGFRVIEDQIFPLETDCYGRSCWCQPWKSGIRGWHFFTKEDGTVVYRTDQLAANSWNVGTLKQPVEEIGAVSFQDLNRDGRLDIVLIVSCRNRTGSLPAGNIR